MGKSKRAAGHARRVRTCKCGRSVAGNAYTLHVRTCKSFIDFYLAHSPGVLRRRGIDPAAIVESASRAPVLHSTLDR